MNRITKKIVENLNSEYITLRLQEQELLNEIERIIKDIGDVQDTINLLRNEPGITGVEKV